MLMTAGDCITSMHRRFVIIGKMKECSCGIRPKRSSRRKPITATLQRSFQSLELDNPIGSEDTGLHVDYWL